jgi:ribosome biogenesis ATPase
MLLAIKFLNLNRILEILCKKIKMSADIEIEKIVLNTPGYVGADLNALIDEALISSLDRRLIEQISNENKENKDFILNRELCFFTVITRNQFLKAFIFSVIEWIKNKLKSNSTIEVEDSDQSEDKAKNAADIVEVNQNDFDVSDYFSLFLFTTFKKRLFRIIEVAIQRVQPSSKREGFATVPDVSWDDVGALKNVREELKIAILVINCFLLESNFKFFFFNNDNISIGSSEVCSSMRDIQFYKTTRHSHGRTARLR